MCNAEQAEHEDKTPVIWTVSCESCITQIQIKSITAIVGTFQAIQNKFFFFLGINYLSHRTIEKKNKRKNTGNWFLVLRVDLCIVCITSISIQLTGDALDSNCKCIKSHQDAIWIQDS